MFLGQAAEQIAQTLVIYFFFLHKMTKPKPNYPTPSSPAQVLNEFSGEYLHIEITSPDSTIVEHLFTEVDVLVKIGEESCANVTVSKDKIICNPPNKQPKGTSRG